MLRKLYSALWYFAAPLIRRYLRRRAGQAPAYLEHWNERFGGAYPDPVQNAIWVHAVSVGETRAAVPLVAELRRRFPDAPLLLTQMTPTGRAAAQSLFADAQCRYLPYDRPDWIRRFLREHRPRFGVLMETELWPNLLYGCREENVPLFLANARLSPQSFDSYRKVARLVTPMLGQLSGCFAQTEADAARLAELGAPAPLVCGNTKYDVEIPPTAEAVAAAFRSLIGERPVLVAASTRTHGNEDEAAKILAAWRAYRGDALLVLVPRHPERFQAAFDSAAALGFKVQRRSDGQPLAADTQVWIGDSMGEMFAYYLAADLAFVGGSLVDTGCQNIIEPLACGKPVLFGPSTYHFQAACEGALAAGAALQVQSADELTALAGELLAKPPRYAELAAQAQDFVGRHRGASAKTADAVAQALSRRQGVQAA